MADKGSSTDFFVPDFTEESKGGKKRVKNWPRSTRIIWTIAASLALVMVIIVFNMDDDRRSRRTPISAIPEVRDVNPATGLFSNADAVREMVYRNLREQIAAELSESMQGTPAAAEPERPQASTRVVRRPPSAEYQSARQRGTAAFVAPSGISLGIGGGDGPDASAAPGGDTLNQLLSAMGTGDAGVLGALGAGGGGGVAGIMPRDIVGSDPNAANVAHQDRMNAFLRTNAGAGAASSVQSEYLSSGPRPPLSPYELKTGSIISGVMVGGINSDLPGTILGQVTENV
ncbi:MAG: hypothetical protein FWG71_02455, partial [Synergistaceae bacterium]|nr:hypothetical protein [Synergistaceae bacterium]